MSETVNIPRHALVEAADLINEFMIRIEHIKNRNIAATMMVLLIFDQFSDGKNPNTFPDTFPNWQSFNWDYSDQDKAIIRNAGLALAHSLYNELMALGLVHQGRVPYVTNRVEANNLIVLDYMPY
jgi:hypothetical protein